MDVDEAPTERLSFQMMEGKEGGRAKATLRRDGRRSLLASSPRRCCVGGGGRGNDGGEEVEDVEDGSVVMVRRVSPCESPWLWP